MVSKNHLIKNCSASDNSTTGLVIDSGLITDCMANNNPIGIRLWGPGSVLGNTAWNNSSQNLDLGAASLTSILVDRNSAFGKSTNYFIFPGTTGVEITANNSGKP